MKEPTTEHPRYRKVEQVKGDGRGTQLYMVTVDEGWRQFILCCDMYEWAADWLIDAIGDRSCLPLPR